MSKAANLAGFATAVSPPSNLTVGVITATTVSATNITGAVTGNATGLSGTPNITVGFVTATGASISGNVSIAGTLTYEDVTNVDSVGLITARSGIDVTGGTVVVGSAVTLSSSGINVVGVITATSFSGDGSALTGVGLGTDGSANTTGVITATKFVGNEFVGYGDKLIFSPTITSFSPSDGATGVNALSSPNIVFTFDQIINAGTGTARLRKDSASGTIVESFDIAVGSGITFANQTLTIDPTNNFDYDQEYYLTIDQGMLKNYVGGNNYGLDTYNFTTEAGPVLTSFAPISGSTNVGITTNITLTFDKNIRSGTGTITLRTGSATGSIIESYDVTSSARLTFSTNTLTIDPTSNLSVSTNYYVVVPDEAVAGYSGTDTYNFTTEPEATVSSYSPTNGATQQSISTNISLTFDGPVVRGTGTITLRSGSAGGTIIESYDAASSARISVAGNVWTLDPTSNLALETTYYLVIPNTAILPNYEGLNIGGATASYSFTSEGPPLGSSYEGGYLICCSGVVRWVVAPSSSEVSRTWPARADANTRAQQVSGCTGWFVPTISQLQNPGYTCRTYWDSYCCTWYWSDSQSPLPNLSPLYKATLNMGTGQATTSSGVAQAPQVHCVRSFRCVTY